MSMTWPDMYVRPCLFHLSDVLDLRLHLFAHLAQFSVHDLHVSPLLLHFIRKLRVHPGYGGPFSLVFHLENQRAGAYTRPIFVSM